MDRFLRYVKIDTQSAEDAGKWPSTEKQLVLARLLEGELKALGVQKVRISPEGIVYGMVPGNLADNSKVPTIGFIAHMDTSPAVSGANVNAIIHRNYQGGDIVLRLDDGRQARARLASTTFLAASERVCDLTGLEPLA